MKRFSSYGPPNPKTNFMVQRNELVEQIAGQLEGTADELGHYFTIFAPRQVGKTTALRQVVTALREKLGKEFNVGMATMHSLKDFRRAIPKIFRMAFGLTVKLPKHWDQVQEVFYCGGPLKKPTILILDEFDGLPPDELAEAVASFRQLYLERETNHLHGLALIGVHSVLGELTSRMSPFNIQRSVNIPNFTREEVIDLYGQYTAESGQPIAPEGVERIYDMFRGQPGLTCWFGELLTEKRTPVQPPPWRRKEGLPPEGYPLITLAEVDRVLTLGMFSEMNVNIKNLTSKAFEYQGLLQELFVSHNIRFDLNDQDIQWLYLNGILVGDPRPDGSGTEECAFASPFVQHCLFSAFGKSLNQAYRRAQLVFHPDTRVSDHAILHLEVPVLLDLYRQFLAVQTANGQAPWLAQPTRADARAFEAIGHFNLYAWLYGVSKGNFQIAPEFPTGNGTADLVLMNHAKGQEEVLEVKSFTSTSDLDKAVDQAARYARKLKLPRSYLVVIADASAYAMLSTLQKRYEVADVTVTLEVIPWGFVPDGGDAQGLLKHVLPHVEGGGQEPGTRQHTLRPLGFALSGPSLFATKDRLALERLMVPLLTPSRLRRVWSLCGFIPPAFTEETLLDEWDTLLLRCASDGRMSDLVEVLRFTFPELAADPLLTKLETLG